MSIPSVIVIEREICCPRLSRERGLLVSPKAGEALPASGREVELMVSELSSPFPPSAGFDQPISSYPSTLSWQKGFPRKWV
jgi:hypothetical protein